MPTSRTVGSPSQRSSSCPSRRRGHARRVGRSHCSEQNGPTTSAGRLGETYSQYPTKSIYAAGARARLRWLDGSLLRQRTFPSLGSGSAGRYVVYVVLETVPSFESSERSATWATSVATRSTNPSRSGLSDEIVPLGTAQRTSLIVNSPRASAIAAGITAPSVPSDGRRVARTSTYALRRVKEERRRGTSSCFPFVPGLPSCPEGRGSEYSLSPSLDDPLGPMYRPTSRAGGGGGRREAA